MHFKRSEPSMYVAAPWGVVADHEERRYLEVRRLGYYSLIPHRISCLNFQEKIGARTCVGGSDLIRRWVWSVVWAPPGLPWLPPWSTGRHWRGHQDHLLTC